MNSYLNIVIRVGAAKAQATLAALRAQMGGVRAETVAMNRTSPFGAAAFSSLTKFGSRLQWVGRQLQYNFTLPILLAGGAAVKFAMDQQKAFVHVTKVYGDLSSATKFFRKQSDGALSATQAHTKALKAQQAELASLDNAFTAISNHYGVQKKDVNEVAGAWAAAGASGERLAQSVNDTMQAMIIGDMDAMTATQSLISIQAQYNLNSKQLMGTLALLNNVENQTGISMSGLIDGFTRAAGVARAAGVDVRHLAAMLAALVPATGSAANAGQALKTIFSRLLAPTKDSIAVMNAMGLGISSLKWQSASAGERLQIMQRHFEKLGSSAKVAAASVIASRWQINKFEILMDELGKKTGFYQKALDAAKNSGNNFKVMQSELNAVLKSDPRSLSRMMVMLQNASVKIIQPLIPFIIYLAGKLGDLATAFSNLDPHVQKLILFGLVVLALIGPLVRYIGAIKILVGLTGTTVTYLAAAFIFLGKAFLILPFQFVRAGFTMLFGIIGMLVPESMAAAVGSMTVWGLLAKFFAAWNLVVEKIWAVGNLARLRIWAAGLMAQLSVTKAWALVQLLNIRVFFARFRLEMIAGSLLGLSPWATMWAIMKGITITGLATQFGLFRRAMGIFAIFKLLGTALVVGWRATWVALRGISAAGWALMRAQWAAQALLGIGIFTKLRSALIVIWETTALAGAVIWRGMALALVAFSRAGIMGVINVFKALIPFMLRFGKFLTGPWGIAILIITTLVAAFHKQIVQIFHNIWSYLQSNFSAVGKLFGELGQGISNVFHKLPQVVQNSMLAVVRTVAAAAKAVYSWFGYLNPFAHHSPSLVENVKKGMGKVVDHHKQLGGIKPHVMAAYQTVQQFGNQSAGLISNAATQQHNADRKSLRQAGASPKVIASYNHLVGLLKSLTPILDRLGAKMQAQQNVVDKWQNRVDAANRKLDVQQKILDKLNATLQKNQDKLAAAQDRLNAFASAPLKGMQAMNDKIEANTVSQNKLKLAMMNMEDAVGPLDKIKGKLDAINGAQEMLRGKRTDLALGGAGSDILKTYDDQIKALDKQKTGYITNANALQAMQDQLDALQRTADRLDLVKALKFDDLEYQIQKTADMTKELSFDDIMTGIKGAKDDIGKYSKKVDVASAAVAKQQKVVDRLTNARDKLQNRLDKEQNTLDKITKRYNKVNDAIQAINDSINSVVDAANQMNQAMAAKKAKAKGPADSPGLANFKMAGNASFPDPGGLGIGPRKNWKSQAKQIDKFTQQLSQQTADMFAQINPFTPLKAKAVQVWNWIKKKYHEIVPHLFSGMKNPFDVIFKGVKGNQGFMKGLAGVGKFGTKVFHDISKAVRALWKLFSPDLKRIFGGLIHGFQQVWKDIAPEIKKFGPLIKPLGQALANLWAIIKPILVLIALRFIFLAKIITSVLAEVIGPLFKILGKTLAGFLQMIRGVLEIFIAILTLNWSMLWQGLKDLMGGSLKIMVNMFKGFFIIIWNVAQGIVKGVVHFFKWLWDELVGHSIVPDIIHGILKWFKKLVDLGRFVWEHVLKPVLSKFKLIWTLIKAEVAFWWPKIKTILSGFATIAKWFWDHVLKPLWDKFSTAFGKIHDVVTGAKDKIGTALGLIKDKFSGVIDYIKGIPATIKNFGDNFLGAGKHIIGQLWKGMKNAGSVISDIGGSIWGYVKGVLNSGIKTVNDAIPNSLGKGPIKVDLPDNPFPYFMYTGGIVRGSRSGTPVTLGDRGYDEAVIPLTGPYAPRWARYQDGKPMNPKSMQPITKNNTFIFNGDLSFPNVKSGDDVDTLISNLENLAS
jgi:TP901 family phage tail tape measure protein